MEKFRSGGEDPADSIRNRHRQYMAGSWPASERDLAVEPYKHALHGAVSLIWATAETIQHVPGIIAGLSYLCWFYIRTIIKRQNDPGKI
ncbi:MAG: hypothetical protein LBF27_30095 [Sphingobacterium sp.]|nr:hypothetical protein [Sphingobacterium sp.]